MNANDWISKNCRFAAIPDIFVQFMDDEKDLERRIATPKHCCPCCDKKASIETDRVGLEGMTCSGCGYDGTFSDFEARYLIARAKAKKEGKSASKFAQANDPAKPNVLPWREYPKKRCYWCKRYGVEHPRDPRKEVQIETMTPDFGGKEWVCEDCGPRKKSQSSPESAEVRTSTSVPDMDVMQKAILGAISFISHLENLPPPLEKIRQERLAELRNALAWNQPKEKSDSHSLNPHPEDNDDGW
jgi:hypothetical protein